MGYKKSIIAHKELKGYDVTLIKNWEGKYMIAVKDPKGYHAFRGKAEYIGDGNRLYNKVLRDIYHGVFQEV